MIRVAGSSPHFSTPTRSSPTGFRAWANFALAWLAFAGVMLFLALWAQGAVTNDRHAGLWGALAAVWLAPFAPAFWLAGRGWTRRWRAALLLQLLPVAVLLGWMLVGRWLGTGTGASPA